MQNFPGITSALDGMPRPCCSSNSLSLGSERQRQMQNRREMQGRKAAHRARGRSESISRNRLRKSHRLHDPLRREPLQKAVEG